MTITAPTGVHRTRTWAGAIALAFVVLLTLFIPTTAHAASPTCTPDDTTGCVQGTIRTSAGEPAVDVEITITSPSGEEQSIQTDETGRWVFAVTESGSYELALNAETLPDGEFLVGETSRTVNAGPHNNVSQAFRLSDTEGGATDSGSSFSWSRFWQQFASGIRLGLMIALASIGLSLVFGTTGLSNFAQGEQVTLGGLLAFTFANVLGLNLWLAGLIAVLLCAATGWLQDAIIWKPLRRRRLSLTQMMIVSIGLSVAMSYFYQMIYGASTVRVDTSSPDSVIILGIRLTVQSYVAMGIAIVVLVAVGLALLFTRVGRATRAISDNSALASASGIDVDRVIRLVWTVSAGLAGLAGVLLALVLNGISWFTGGQLLLLIFAAVTLGGLGTAFGALAGSMIIGLVVELTNLWLPGDFKYATALLALILILLVRPQGIFGRRERVG
ncbi:branched-chain amino acid ABC transporter permease [Microbacterium sp.]|uniref:branched-chain amino acid ABC transporter permease n=1 Tax=Microbacterium sp. TaxID=51671 RepID=UPI003C70EEBF